MRISSLPTLVTIVAYKMVVTVFANIGHIVFVNLIACRPSLDNGRLYIPLKSEFGLQSQTDCKSLNTFRHF